MLKQTSFTYDKKGRIVNSPVSIMSTTTDINSSGDGVCKLIQGTDCEDFRKHDSKNYLMFGSGVMTFGQAEKVFNHNLNRRRRADKAKALTADTYLKKVSENEYLITYYNLVIHIFRTHWLIGTVHSSIMLPGITNRVQWFTGCNMFRSYNLDQTYYLGSMRRPFRINSSRKSGWIYAAVDYSEPQRYKERIWRPPILQRTPETEINSRRTHRLNAYYGQSLYGRSKSLFYDDAACLRFLNDVIDKYAQEFISSYIRKSANFLEFISESKASYQPINTYDSGNLHEVYVDKLPTTALAESFPNGGLSYLYAGEQCSLYCPHSYLRSELGSKRKKLLSGMLLQSVYLMRGYDSINIGSIDSLVGNNLIDPNIPVGSYTIHDSFTGNHSRNRRCILNKPDITPAVKNLLASRAHFYRLWLKHMLTFSPGGHEKCRPELGLVEPGERARTHSWSNNYSYGNSGSDLYMEKGVATITDNIWETYKNRRYWQQPSLSDLFDDTSVKNPVPLNRFTNPFPRLTWFLMFDEFCCNSILPKQNIINLIAKEWTSLPYNPSSEDIMETAPTAINVMSSFLKKRVSGLMLPLLVNDKSEFSKIYFHNQMRNYSGSPGTDNAPPVGTPASAYVPTDHIIPEPESVS